MTDAERLDHGSQAPHGVHATVTDPELILEVRAGVTAAYEELFVRHRDVAIRYARRLAGPERADDLCAEAFARILDLLQRGKGPDVAFRAYLLTTVRTGYLNTIRAGTREELVPDHEAISRMTPVTEDPDRRFDQGAICRAFYRLPGRWQSALWLTEVEGLSNGEAGRHLGISANAVASLSFRARVGLRQAFLAEHLLETTDPICRRIVELLPSHRRGTLTARRRTQVDGHLETCRSCTTAAVELNHVDTGLGALIGPAALTGFAVWGAGVVHAPGAGLVGTAVAAKAATALGHAKTWGAGAPAVSVAKVAVIASVAAVGVAVGSDTLMNHPPHHRAPRAPSALRSTLAGAPTLRARPDVPAPSPPVLVAAGDGPAVIPLPPEVATPQPSVGPMPSTPSPDGPRPSSPPPSPSPPSSPPPSSPPPSEPPAPPQRATAVGPMSSSRFQRNLTHWNRVTVPVSDPVKDSALRLTTNRTIDAALVTDTTSGWICGVPTLHWVDGGPYATSVTECRYNGHGDGSALEIEYRVGSGAHLTAALTPPAGVSDTSLTDNQATLDLRA